MSLTKIAIVGGAGYVGLSYAAAFAELGYNVVGLDLDSNKVQSLSEGRCPIFEPGLEELLQRGLTSGRLRFTTEYSHAVPGANFVFICVGTPSDITGRAQMMYVKKAAEDIARHMDGHTFIVNKSTMPVGSGDLVARILNQHKKPDVTFTVVSNPEFLREGSAVHDIFHPDRIVLGADDPIQADQVAALYAALGAPVLVTDLCSAEMIKYASNALLATKISFVNEVATICEQLGADVDVVSRGMGMDDRIGPRFLRAGAGFGGSCFPKDVRALASMARDAGVNTSMLNAVLTINADMQRLVVDKVRGRLGGLSGKTVAVLGLAFKPNTDDVREAPALVVIKELLAAGARVRATDPVAMEHVAELFPGIELCRDPYATVMGADAVVLMTEWDDYRAMDLGRMARAMRGRLLIDGRNVYDLKAVQAIGLTYEGIGRAVSKPAHGAGLAPWEPQLTIESDLDSRVLETVRSIA